MINVPAGARILLATLPIDFRKGAHGLAALAQEVLAEDPFSGTVIVYRSKRSDRVKILVWDTSGLVLIWKQLPQGSFHWPPIMDGVVRLSAVEFTALFDGLDWTRVQATKEILTPTVAAFARDRFGLHQRAEPARECRGLARVGAGDVRRTRCGAQRAGSLADTE